MVRVIHADCLTAMAELARDGVQVQSVVTDPPYHLTSIVKRFGGENAAPAKDRDGLYKRASAGFMGKQWDGGDVAFRPETWRLCFDLLPPGGHLVAFGGTRTHHRIWCAIEDAGFELRDTLAWLYGSGFPKSHDVSKAIDKAAGAERVRSRKPKAGEVTTVNVYAQDAWTKANGNSRRDDTPITAEAEPWAGWGTSLKPAYEPCILARKPLAGTVAATVLAHGTGAINVDGCRVGTEATTTFRRGHSGDHSTFGGDSRKFERENPPGRWPANVVHDGSDEVLAAFPDVGVSSGGKGAASQRTALGGHVYGDYSHATLGQSAGGLGDSGSAARFFYSAKADAADRCGSKHPTVKPVDLMAWLVRLVTPPGGTVLDPFAGSGSTGMACIREGFDAILIEREADYVADIRRRLGHVDGADTPLFAGVM